MVAQLDSAVVRLRNSRGAVVGAGFLVGHGHVLTCAHVVARALDQPEETPAPVDAEVMLDFPLVAPGEVVTARILVWQPPSLDFDGDVAGLELTGDPPAGAQPVRLLVADEVWRHEFRTFGFPSGYDDGVWASGRLLARQAMQWIQMEDVKETGYRVESGFSGAPVWDDELDGVVGMTVAAERRPELRAAYLIPAGILVEAWPILAAQAIPPCPYRGLFAFREQDAALFLGREEVTDQLRNEVTGNPLVTVIGPSGSGKSSLVSAGLLPSLRQRSEWAITDLRPAGGLSYMEVLAWALLPKLEPEMSEAARLLELPRLAAVLRDGRLAQVVDRILDRAGARRLLLVIDQFEELFTSPAADRRLFVDVLLGSVSAQLHRAESALSLVLILRADFLGQALADARLATAVQGASLMLGPMTRDELRRTIEEPAAHQVVYEAGLVDRILDDVGEEFGNLPLLQFTLTLLWDRQANGKLTHAAYNELGGVSGALARYAEEAYLRLPEPERDEARRIFVQLVRPGEGTEHTRRVARRPDMDERRWQVVQRLASTRLVVTGQDAAGTATVEVVHEALIANWYRLRGWVEADRSFRGWQERIRSTIIQWETSGHDDGVLLRGAPLAEAERWLDERTEEIASTERTFVEASRQRQDEELTRTARRNRRLRALAGALSVLLVVAVIAAFWAVAQTRLADTQKHAAQAQAQVAGSRELAQEALTNLDKRPDLALMQSVRAFGLADTVQARSSLLAALNRAPQVEAFLPGPSPLYNLAFGAGGRTIVMNAGDTLVIWDLLKQQRITEMRVPGPSCMSCDSSNTTFLSPRGRILAWADKGAMRLWDVDDHKPLAPLPGDINHSIAFNRDETVAAVSSGARVDIWDLRSRKHLTALSIAGSGYGISAITLQPHGGLLAGMSNAGGVKLWDLRTHQSLGKLPSKALPAEARSGYFPWIDFSPDAKTLVMGGPSEVAVWNIPRRKTVARTRLPAEGGGEAGPDDPLAFSPDGLKVAFRASISNYSIAVLDTKTGRKSTLTAHHSKISSLAFGPHGHHLISGSIGDNAAIVWDLDRPPTLARPIAHVGGAVAAMAVRGPDRASIWTLNSEGTVTATEVESGTARSKWSVL